MPPKSRRDQRNPRDDTGLMIRAAIYARFSSDLQSDKSIDDQIALCRDVCAREGMAVISTFEDRAISGTATVNRPGFRALMHAAEARLFDAIVIEDIDRLSRDQGDYHAARKRLDFLGVHIHTATGKVGKLDGALRALMGEMFIENLVLHVRRGMAGVIRDGRRPAGQAYGYRPIAGKPGEHEIVQAEAEIIRAIFAAYVGGKTPRSIAADLNARGIRPPRGALWNASTINGNFARGGGILLNEIYAGTIIWNKVRMIKDPSTGKRISRPNPKSEHHTAAAEHLRIIDNETWQAAQALKAKHHNATPSAARAPKRAFSGLLKCGSCGGGMTSIGSDKKGLRVQCSTHRESGACDNGRRVYLDEIEQRVLSGLRAELSNPILITEYVTAYNDERRRLKRQAGNDSARLDRRAGEIERELNRIIDSIVDGSITARSVAPRIKALETERDAVEAGRAEAQECENVITLHPAAIDRYRRDVATLDERLKGASGMDGRAEVFESIRRLVSRIIIKAKPNVPGFEIDLRGRLAELCAAPMFPSRSLAGGSMVAGEGLEPPTPGL